MAQTQNEGRHGGNRGSRGGKKSLPTAMESVPSITNRRSRRIKNPYACKQKEKCEEEKRQEEKREEEAEDVRDPVDEIRPVEAFPDPAVAPMAPAALPQAEAKLPLAQFDALDDIDADGDDLGALASTFRQLTLPPSLFQDTDASTEELECNTPKYEKHKKKAVNRFFEALTTHPSTVSLAVIVVHPEDPSHHAQRFFVQLGGTETPLKEKVFSRCMVVWSMMFIKIAHLGKDLTEDKQLLADAQCQPNVIAFEFRMLFLAFKDTGNLGWSQEREFNHTGGFQACWKNVFGHCRKFRPDCGKTPNHACFDAKFREKRAACMTNPNHLCDPMNDYHHFMLAVAEEACVCFGLRGRKEPAHLVRSNFIFSVMPQGSAFEGQNFMQLKVNHEGQAGNELSLTNHTVNPESADKHCLPFVQTDDPLGLYNLLCRLFYVLMPPIEMLTKGGDRIFRPIASKKQRKKWEKDDLPHLSNPNTVRGEGWFNDASIELAELCGYDNAKKCTSHGRRHDMISTVTNADGLGPAMQMALNRHASLETSAVYQVPNQACQDRATLALQPASNVMNNENVDPDNSSDDDGLRGNSPVESVPSNHSVLSNCSNRSFASVASSSRVGGARILTQAQLGDFGDDAKPSPFSDAKPPPFSSVSFLTVSAPSFDSQSVALSLAPLNVPSQPVNAQANFQPVNLQVNQPNFVPSQVNQANFQPNPQVNLQPNPQVNLHANHQVNCQLNHQVNLQANFQGNPQGNFHQVNQQVNHQANLQGNFQANSQMLQIERLQQQVQQLQQQVAQNSSHPQQMGNRVSMSPNPPHAPFFFASTCSTLQLSTSTR